MTDRLRIWRQRSSTGPFVFGAVAPSAFSLVAIILSLHLLSSAEAFALAPPTQPAASTSPFARSHALHHADLSYSAFFDSRSPPSLRRSPLLSGAVGASHRAAATRSAGVQRAARPLTDGSEGEAEKWWASCLCLSRSGLAIRVISGHLSELVLYLDSCLFSVESTDGTEEKLGSVDNPCQDPDPGSVFGNLF